MGQPITFQHRALRRDRRQPEADWKRTFDAVPHPIMVLDQESRIQRANQAAVQTTGLELSQIIGRHCYEVLHNTKEPPPYCPHLAILQSDQPGRGDLEEPRLGKTFDMTCSPVRDDQGVVTGSVQVLADITERHQAEGALAASEIRYRRLFEAAKDGILILDAASGEIVDANPFLEKLLRYSHEELLGKKLWDLGLFEDNERSKTVFKELQEKGQVRYDDLPLKGSDGSHRHVEFVSNVYQVDQTKVIQCNIRDITERHQAEGALVASEIRYRRLFEAAKDGILILDAASGEIVDANPFLEKLLRYSHEEILGKKLWDIGLFEDIERSKAVFKELQERGQVRYDNLPLEGSDGRHRHVEFVSNVYQVDHTNVIQCNIRDITDHHRAEGAIREKATLQEQMSVILATVPGAVYSFLMRPDGSTSFPIRQPKIPGYFWSSSDSSRSGRCACIRNGSPGQPGATPSGDSGFIQTVDAVARRVPRATSGTRDVGLGRNKCLAGAPGG